jgi:hypothetical protein
MTTTPAWWPSSSAYVGNTTSYSALDRGYEILRVERDRILNQLHTTQNGYDEQVRENGLLQEQLDTWSEMALRDVAPVVGKHSKRAVRIEAAVIERWKDGPLPGLKELVDELIQ